MGFGVGIAWVPPLSILPESARHAKVTFLGNIRPREGMGPQTLAFRSA